ncbi:MAG: energy-coupled thiamine transporter ThiT [Ruminococcus sp.]|nr:energy-coupled thiamine transporter ThiT [Ruminococcus sp.]
MKKKRVLMLTETAILIALATVLSMVKLFDLPYGGSITAFSMVPIMVVAFRYGTKWGLLAGFVNSLIQLLLGANNLSYATSPAAAVAIIMFDYVLAFSFIGLAGVFSKVIKDKPISAVAGATLVCAIRYISHVISGCTVWAGISIPTTAALLYSLSYNATYMIPETIISVAVAYWLCSSLDFTTDTISRAKKTTSSALTAALSSISVLSIAVAVIVDAVMVFSPLQNAESGELDFSLISNVNLPLIGIVSAVGVVLCIVFAVVAKLTKKKTNA